MPGIAIFGVTGRMGQALVRVLREGAAAAPAAREARLSGALASPSSARLGLDASADGPPSGVLVSADPAVALGGADLAIDFSAPQAIAAHARACAERRVALLVGTTGLDGTARAALERAAGLIPVLVAPNTSLAVGVLKELASAAAAALGPDYDVEISEAHHRMKRDAPSGTALALGEAVAAARGTRLEQVACYERHGTGQPRIPGSIGFAVLRAGDIVGEHTVTFAGAGERLELTHRATDRTVFARGALRAGLWLAGRPPGTYTMRDVLAR